MKRVFNGREYDKNNEKIASQGARRINPNPLVAKTSPAASNESPTRTLSHGAMIRVPGLSHSMVCTMVTAKVAMTRTDMSMIVANPIRDRVVNACNAGHPSVRVPCVRASASRQSRSAGTPRRHRRKMLEALPDVLGP